VNVDANIVHFAVPFLLWFALSSPTLELLSWYLTPSCPIGFPRLAITPHNLRRKASPVSLSFNEHG
jgi:hypothetical protein